ncbi:TraM recognition domain-containing protein [Chitinophaga sp. SYP-B3965]|uniref:type IV secretory system conjugative DNA transfer family protein n=1 Tax=Chitinophaga sp. SYP-B3965 TaxID=2663120 RepID=UPI001299E98A|nr:type IV secretory system conjugative DNA transfer family protein [Chitinophaga sp. SYP-B3965]MRG48290.1 TraM recognition domain-containing protein [Chitinophaga sp. SYP-B3965]
MSTQKTKDWFDISQQDIAKLFRTETEDEPINKIALYVIGIFFTPITLIGALIGYVRGYKKFMDPIDMPPKLGPLLPIVRVAMIIGAALIWVALFALYLILPWVWVDVLGMNNKTLIYFLFGNFIFSVVAFIFFKKWQIGAASVALEKDKFGSARFARPDELAEFQKQNGLYIGGANTFSGMGHLLTVAGTRGGKGRGLIIPNLLGMGNYSGSWVVIDPKAENAAITARYQRERGQNVVVLNPWGLLQENIGDAQNYNPLDILSDRTSIHLIDDVAVIAEMIVPAESGGNNFFSDNARSIVTGLLLHLVTSIEDTKERTLTTLWKWLRYTGDDWNKLIADMRTNDDEANGLAVRMAGSEIMKLMEAGERTYGSIMAVALQSTSFLNSPALQQSLSHGFDPATLADGTTTVYVVIPADKLQSHSRWLRLVVTSMMRAVIRKPQNRVTFLLDEFAALGYMSEIEIALSTYAGYNVTVWAILQTLTQLANMYAKNWETFIANTAVKQYFSINDNFSANYISAAIGMTSHVIVTKTWFRIVGAQSNSRPLITPDELRRESGTNMFVFINDKPAAIIPKIFYDQVDGLRGRYDGNPYIKSCPA